MALTVDSDTAKDILAKAFLESVPKEYQQQLLADAVKHVFTEREKYGEKTNMLDKLFREVCCSYAKQRVDELMKTDADLQARLDAITQEVMLEAMQQFRDTIGTTFKAVLDKALSGRGY